MDRKMRKVSKQIRKGEKIIEKAARKNDKLANYDEKVRDPIIEKYQKMKKKGCKQSPHAKMFFLTKTEELLGYGSIRSIR